MGIWYFLILFVGIFLVVKGLLGNKRNGLVLIGVIVLRSQYLCFNQEVMKSFQNYLIFLE